MEHTEACAAAETVETQAETAEMYNGEMEKAPTKRPKEDRFLAIYLDGGIERHVTAPNKSGLKKKLEKVCSSNIVAIWRGKRRELQTKTVAEF